MYLRKNLLLILSTEYNFIAYSLFMFRVTEIHECMNHISKKIQYQPENKFYRTSETAMANGIFMQQDFPINENYIQLFKKYHDGNVSNVDFSGHSTKTTDDINR